MNENELMQLYYMTQGRPGSQSGSTLESPMQQMGRFAQGAAGYGMAGGAGLSAAAGMPAAAVPLAGGAVAARLNAATDNPQDVWLNQLRSEVMRYINGMGRE